MNMTTQPPVNQTNVTWDTDVNQQQLLKFNSDLAEKLLPLTVLLWFYLVIGVLGNSLVMFVYWARKKPVQEERYMIPLLALVNLISCIISSGTEIYTYMYPVMFDSNVGCKMAAFLGCLFALISADFLLVIAVDRYLKLCRPFGRQVTLRIKKTLIFGICVICLAFSLPFLIIYRAEQVPIDLKSGYIIQALKCVDTTDTETDTGYIIYKLIMFVMTIIVILIMFLCYGNIIWVILRHRKRRLRMRPVQTYTSASTSYNHDTVEGSKIQTDNTNERQSEEDAKKTKEIENEINDGFKGIELCKQYLPKKQYPKQKQKVVLKTGSAGNKGSVAQRQGIRLTIIFLLITFIHIVTYGPKMWLMVEQSRKGDFSSTVQQGRLLLYTFLHSFYIFNYIVNPIVYGIMDRQFRVDCKERFTRCK